MIRKSVKVLDIEAQIEKKEILFEMLADAQKNVILVCEHCGHEQKAKDTELAHVHLHDGDGWTTAGYFFHCNKCFCYKKNCLLDREGNWPLYPKIDSFKHYEFAFSKGVIIWDRDQNGCILNFEYFRNLE
jgi:hypothetical protein